MKDYHKINGLYNRDRNNGGRFILDEFAKPEFEYLFNCKWIGTEKIDGTNIKINWDGDKVRVGGRRENSNIPALLVEKLNEYIAGWDFPTLFPKEDGTTNLTLYGEGYGTKIQKVGKEYIPDGVDFILFDITIDEENGTRRYLNRKAVDAIAKKLGIKSVPVIFEGTLAEGIELVRKGLPSRLGDLLAEGLVVVPACEMQTRNGERIITKLKSCDFR